jgi:CubicO group peptidase (beta-lactamase class C family)
MLKWDKALNSDKLISSEEQQLGYTPSMLKNGKPAAIMGFAYGFGWLIQQPKEHTGKIYLHTGGYPGYTTIISRYPEKNKVIIILTNTYNITNIFQLWAATEDILFNRPFEIPKALPFKKSIFLTPSQIHEIEGVYSLSPGVKYIITSDLNGVYAQISGQPKAQIYPETALDFFYTIVSAKLSFKRDGKGKIKGLSLFQFGREFRAKKDD